MKFCTFRFSCNHFQSFRGALYRSASKTAQSQEGDAWRCCNILLSFVIVEKVFASLPWSSDSRSSSR